MKLLGFTLFLGQKLVLVARNKYPIQFVLIAVTKFKKMGVARTWAICDSIKEVCASWFFQCPEASRWFSF